MSVDSLLSQVTALSRKHDSIQQRTGGFFNIFSIANIQNDEVKICRVIHELLDPKGSHYQGSIYLELFCTHVLSIQADKQDFEQAAAYREYVTVNGRRIDLAIVLGDRFIPIEVKIYAGDQPRQCADYHMTARNFDVVYLTLDGALPSAQSADGLEPIRNETDTVTGYKGVRLVSFRSEILTWLNKCLEHQSTLRIGPIRVVLLQLISTLRTLTNQIDEGKEYEMNQIIMSSKENMKSALEIESSLRDCKEVMLLKVLSEIEDRIGRAKLRNEFDYEYDGKKLIHSYYDRKASSFPGISYLIQPAIKPNVDLWFRVEVDYNIFAGYCTAKKGKSSGEQLSPTEIKALLPNLGVESDGWWVYWEHLPVDDENRSANFKEFNDIYLNLFDPTGFDHFLAESMKRIDFLLNNR